MVFGVKRKQLLLQSAQGLMPGTLRLHHVSRIGDLLHSLGKCSKVAAIVGHSTKYAVHSSITMMQQLSSHRLPRLKIYVHFLEARHHLCSKAEKSHRR
jgi:hypothetical protein